MPPPLCPLQSDADLDPLIDQGQELAKQLPPILDWLEVQTHAGQRLAAQSCNR
jgi:hypothetical protein